MHPYQPQANQNFRYQISAEIAKTPAFSIYSGFDPTTQKQVFIKLLNPQIANSEQIGRTAPIFYAQANALAQLKHPNILPFLEFNFYQQTPFWASETVPGGSLQQFLTQPVHYAQAAAILLPLAQALSFAHSHGLIHGDLTPASIIFKDNQTPMITDFALIQTLRENGIGINPQSGETLIGTPEYMAPEQAMLQRCDARTDIYALGIIFYEMLTGQKPFSGSSTAAILSQQVNYPLPNAGGMFYTLPQAVQNALYRATAKRAEERFQSMDEFSQILYQISVQSTQITNNVPYTPESDPSETFIAKIKSLLSKENLSKVPKKMWGFLASGCVALIILIMVISTSSRNTAVNATNTAIAATARQAETEVQERVLAQFQATEEARQKEIATQTQSAIDMQATLSVPTVQSINSLIIPTAGNSNAPAVSGGTDNARYQSQTPNDGVVVTRNYPFTIQWAVENTGDSTWNTAYTLKYLSGTNFATNQVTTYSFPEDVWKNGATTFKLPVTAPNTAGTYEMYWNLTNASGATFGPTLSFKIVVEGDTVFNEEGTAVPTAEATATLITISN